MPHFISGSINKISSKVLDQFQRLKDSNIEISIEDEGEPLKTCTDINTPK